MTPVRIVKADAVTTKQLIIEMHDGLITAEQAKTLEGCLGPTSDLWIGFLGRQPVCAWGLVPPTMLSDRAYLWLYATPAIDEHKFLFIRHSMRVMESLRDLYPIIHGVCDIDNTRAIRWLKRLGAVFSDPYDGHVPFVIGGRNG